MTKVENKIGGTTLLSSYTYTYNELGQRAEREQSGSAFSSTNKDTFSYDYLGQVTASTNDTQTAAEWNPTYAYDEIGNRKSSTGVSPVSYETNSLNQYTQVSGLSLHTTYLWGLDLSGSMQGAGGVGGLLKEGDLYPTYDANGNIVQKLNSSGVAAMKVEYDPFGNVIAGYGTWTGEYGFSTKPLIESIQMYYYGFSYYDPETGRWPSRDPISEWGFLIKTFSSYYKDLSSLRSWSSILKLYAGELISRYLNSEEDVTILLVVRDLIYQTELYDNFINRLLKLDFYSDPLSPNIFNKYRFINNNAVNLLDLLGLADLNLHKPGSKADRLADAQKNSDNTFSVSGHGTPKSVTDETGKVPKKLTAKELADKIKQHPDYDAWN